MTDVDADPTARRRMRIVMLGPFGLHPKGTMRARALPAARALAARGHHVTLLMPPWHTPAEAGRAWDDVPDGGDHPSGVHLEYVSLAGLGWPVLGELAVASRMAARALELAPDVVHAFKPKAYSGLAATFLRGKQRLGGRFGLVMDTDDWEGPGGWNDLEPYGPIHRHFFAWQEQWGLRHADHVTVASRALETLVLAMGVPPDRLTYVPNGILESPGELALTTPATSSRDVDHPPTLLLYTRFFEFALDRPLEVLRRVREKWPTARLVVAGKGLFGEEETFLELARGMGLAEAVDYRGWVEPGDETTELFGSADVALYPFDDTLINRTKSSAKLLELMAAGVPVVAEAVGQNAQVVEHGISGVLVGSGDVAGTAAAVSALLGDPARRAAMGVAARARVAGAFRWETLVERLESAYAGARGVAGG